MPTYLCIVPPHLCLGGPGNLVLFFLPAGKHREQSAKHIGSYALINSNHFRIYLCVCMSGAKAEEEDNL